MLEAADVAEAHYNLGVALEAQGRTDEARAEYERARALKPGLRQASVNLGVLNLLPVPILDGGHLAFFFIELVTGRPLSKRTREIAQQVGLVLLISLMMLAFYNDIARLLGG